MIIRPNDANWMSERADEEPIKKTHRVVPLEFDATTKTLKPTGTSKKAAPANKEIRGGSDGARCVVYSIDMDS